MSKGVFELTRKVANTAFAGQIVWSSKSNGTTKNSSEVTAELQLMKPNGYTTTGTWKGSFTVGAKTVNISLFEDIGSNWETIATITTTVSHKADGAGTCYLQAQIDGPTQTTVGGSSVTGSTHVSLDKIARFANILSAEDFTDEGNPTITYSNPAGSAVSRLQACISLTGEHADVPFRDIPVTGKSYTFNLTDSERNTLRNATPDSNTLEVKFCIRSTIGEETDHGSINATMSIVNANPTVSFAVEDTNSTTVALTGNKKKLIALHSVAKVTLTASANKGATIPSNGIKITNGKASLTGSGSFSPVTNNNIKYTVTDSRGNKVNGGLAGAIIPYINPTIVIENAFPDTNGEMTLRATGKVFGGSFGSKSNDFSMKYRYRAGSGDYTSWKTFSSAEMDGNDFVVTAELTGLDYKTKYTFQAAVYDSLHTDGVKSKARSFISLPVFEWGESDFRFNVPVSMAGNRITSLSAPAEPEDAIPMSYVNGLGLGAGGRHTEDLNNETTTGWYSFSSGCANAPIKYGIAMVMRRYDGDVMQIAFNPHLSSGNGSREICIRSCVSSTWSAWEYLNPEYKFGVEYPTAERHLGKIVYAKLVDLGTLPNATSKTVAFNSASGVNVVAVEAFAKSSESTITQMFPLITTSGGVAAKVHCTAYNVVVYAFNDMSNYTGYAKIKYTKS